MTQNWYINIKHRNKMIIPIVNNNTKSQYEEIGSIVYNSDINNLEFYSLSGWINSSQGNSVINFGGFWDALNNNPDLTIISPPPNSFIVYIVSVKGNTELNGISDWDVNDWAVCINGVWGKIDNSESGKIKLHIDDTPDFLENKIGGSLEIVNNTLQLVNDNETPGSNRYYGTNELGEKGWHVLRSTDLNYINVSIPLQIIECQPYQSFVVNANLLAANIKLVNPENECYYRLVCTIKQSYINILDQNNNTLVQLKSSGEVIFYYKDGFWNYVLLGYNSYEESKDVNAFVVNNIETINTNVHFRHLTPVKSGGYLVLGSLSTIYLYDLTSGAIYSRSIGSTLRVCYAAGIYNNRLYICGGLNTDNYTGSSSVRSEIMVWDPLIQNNPISIYNLPAPRYGMGSCYENQHIWCVGGYNQNAVVTNVFWQVDVSSGNTDILPSVPQSLGYPQVAKCGSYLIVVGGFTNSTYPNGNPNTDMYVYNFSSSAWQTYELPSVIQSSLQKYVFVSEQKVFIAGFDVNGYLRIYWFNFANNQFVLQYTSSSPIVSSPFFVDTINFWDNDTGKFYIINGSTFTSGEGLNDRLSSTIVSSSVGSVPAYRSSIGSFVPIRFNPDLPPSNPSIYNEEFDSNALAFNVYDRDGLVQWEIHPDSSVLWMNISSFSGIRVVGLYKYLPLGNLQDFYSAVKYINLYNYTGTGIRLGIGLFINPLDYNSPIIWTGVIVPSSGTRYFIVGATMNDYSDVGATDSFAMNFNYGSFYIVHECATNSSHTGYMSFDGYHFVSLGRTNNYGYVAWGPVVIINNLTQPQRIGIDFIRFYNGSFRSSGVLYGDMEYGIQLK